MVNPLFSRYQAVMVSIFMLITFFGCQLFGWLLASRLVLESAQSMSLNQLLFFASQNGTVIALSMYITFVLLVMVIFAIFYWKIRGHISLKRFLALNPISLRLSLKMLGLLLVFIVVSEMLMVWLQKQPMAFVDDFFGTAQPVWLLIVAMVVIVPIYEELVFRGVLWSVIAEQWSGQKGQIIASVLNSLLFAAVHLQYELFEMSMIFILALLFGFARMRSNSLWLPIGLHMVNNAIAMSQYMMDGAGV